MPQSARVPLRLEELPTELVHEVVRQLKSLWFDDEGAKPRTKIHADLCSLRQTCRALRYKAEDLFSDMFKGVCVKSCVKDLEILRQISEHQRYSSTVKTVTDTSDMYQCDAGSYERVWSEYTQLVKQRQGDSETARSKGQKIDELRQLATRLNYIRRSGALTALLTRIFGRLPNVRSLWLWGIINQKYLRASAGWPSLFF